MLWNDDKHSYEEIIKLLADLTRNISRDDTAELTCQIDENGREWWRHRAREVAAQDGHTLTQIGFGRYNAAHTTSAASRSSMLSPSGFWTSRAVSCHFRLHT